MKRKNYTDMFYSFGEELNTYETDLIKKRINPKVCVMSTGADWMYINKLQDRHYANITIIGNDPKLMVELDKVKDYDIIILDSAKPFSEETLADLTRVAGIVNTQYGNDISIIYSFQKDDKSLATKLFYDGNGLEDLGFVDGTCDLKNMIDNAYISIIKKEKEKNKQKKKSK